MEKAWATIHRERSEKGQWTLKREEVYKNVAGLHVYCSINLDLFLKKIATAKMERT